MVAAAGADRSLTRHQAGGGRGQALAATTTRRSSQWWNNEAPTTRAGVGPVPCHSQSVFAPPYFEPPLTPDGPGSWSMSGSSEMPSISSCPAARGRRSVSRDAPPVPAGLLKVRQVPPVVRAPARDPRRERRPRRARRRRPPVARPWGRSQPLDLTGLGRSRRSAKPVDRHQLVSKQDRGLGPDEHLADSAAIATLPLGPQPRNLTVNDADCPPCQHELRHFTPINH